MTQIRLTSTFDLTDQNLNLNVFYLSCCLSLYNSLHTLFSKEIFRFFRDLCLFDSLNLQVKFALLWTQVSPEVTQDLSCGCEFLWDFKKSQVISGLISERVTAVCGCTHHTLQDRTCHVKDFYPDMWRLQSLKTGRLFKNLAVWQPQAGTWSQIKSGKLENLQFEEVWKMKWVLKWKVKTAAECSWSHMMLCTLGESSVPMCWACYYQNVP